MLSKNNINKIWSLRGEGYSIRKITKRIFAWNSKEFPGYNIYYVHTRDKLRSLKYSYIYHSSKLYHI